MHLRAFGLEPPIPQSGQFLDMEGCRDHTFQPSPHSKTYILKLSKLGPPGYPGHFDSPASQKVPAPEPLHQRFRCRQAYQRWRVETLAWAPTWWTRFDVPRRRSIDREDGDVGVTQGLDNRWEWLAHIARETEAWSGGCQRYG
jgi:hypothetical protein